MTQQSAKKMTIAGLRLAVVIFFILYVRIAWAQSVPDSGRVRNERIMFWNVENAFWPLDDPQTNDDEFTPEGARHWTHHRLRDKLQQLNRVILAAGAGRSPMLVGLAEVEGDSVMHYWTHSTTLWNEHYEYLVTHGPDTRGIQIALLYQPMDFRLLGWEGLQVDLGQQRPTRHILHAWGRVVSGDTLDVFVCHMPSRLGGAKDSKPGRDAAHRTLLTAVDSLRAHRHQPQVIIMGDMNDYPSRKSQWWQNCNIQLDNLMLPLQQYLTKKPGTYGSHKYQGEWGYLDQFIVSREMLTEGVNVRVSNARAFHLPFMLVRESTRLGHRPLRSYYGYNYEGGLSDHLPILMDCTITY